MMEVLIRMKSVDYVKRCIDMIPKIIHQTIPDKKNIHPAFLENIRKLKRLNPGWSHRLYDNSEFRSFITDPSILQAYDKYNPVYGVGLANLFKYWISYTVGGVYLDIKSTATKPLDTVLLPNDVYFLSHWNNRTHPGWGQHPELKAKGEYQQWYIVAAPHHPFLAAVLSKCVKSINSYDPIKIGVGKPGELRVSGPVPYTLAIYDIEDKYSYRFVDTNEVGFQYSIFINQRSHEKCFQNHYSTSREPVVL